ncbi:MAG: peptide chain release factor 1 [Syntrophomonadaceae bacterium]|nr:peptide chain release factor 1 [Syntrophomonadaceae bacterium]
MLGKLQQIEDRYEQLTNLLADPEVIADHVQYQKHAKIHAGLAPVTEAFRQYKKVLAAKEEALLLLQDKLEPDFREMVVAELAGLEEKETALFQQLRVLLLPKDPNDEKNVIMEIRAGTGGEEAALFAGVLFRMYARFAEKQGWKTEVLNSNPTDLGGFKEVVFELAGRGAYSKLKFESGVHRVQRVPATESSGRIHTSAATVAVLPEAEEVEVQVSPDDIRIDVFCASGHGGQSVNTTQSAVRITHLPSGIVVSCQDEKSQHKNKERAMKVLRARLLEKAQSEQQGEMANARRLQVGSGDRSERIRTYNYPQGRVTDHRIGLTLHRLEMFLEGDLEEMMQALITTEQAEKLKKVD